MSCVQKCQLRTHYPDDCRCELHSSWLTSEVLHLQYIYSSNVRLCLCDLIKQAIARNLGVMKMEPQDEKCSGGAVQGDGAVTEPRLTRSAAP